MQDFDNPAEQQEWASENEASWNSGCWGTQLFSHVHIYTLFLELLVGR